ncbi:Protein DedA [Oenococcus oeni]|nr:VTT domain-containing protein [Oenococcus oeni]AVI93723.1 cytochrome O ubiquinol oxidase [Oenococcus oeni]SYW01976.1 Protein DedA [Oenococcus oeni]SYW18349.1 Protein DedA [Oenococcus oeni]VDC14159.1 Protein DedA [Oenococcus oeni]
MVIGLVLAYLHFNQIIPELMKTNALLVYGFLFLIIFIETGLIFLPFLPGDSIIFISGNLSNLSGGFNLYIVVIGFIASAVIGDYVNFEFGKHLGIRIIKSNKLKKIFKTKYLINSQKFYFKYGKMAIFLGRFVPIIRTVIPFTAGVSKMNYKSFFRYNIFGAICWILLMALSGFFFGNIPFVKNNFDLFLIGIAFISILPMIINGFHYYFSNYKYGK